MSKKIDNHYLNGWVEVLHRYEDLSEPSTLLDLTFDQYEQVGSNLPLCEYYSPIDIYHHYKEVNDKEFGIPRGFRAYDAINLCSDELNRIATMILIPQDRVLDMTYAGMHTQKLEELPLVMVTRPEIFESFYLKINE